MNPNTRSESTDLHSRLPFSVGGDQLKIWMDKGPARRDSCPWPKPKIWFSWVSHLPDFWLELTLLACLGLQLAKRRCGTSRTPLLYKLILSSDHSLSLGYQNLDVSGNFHSLKNKIQTTIATGRGHFLIVKVFSYCPWDQCMVFE